MGTCVCGHVCVREKEREKETAQIQSKKEREAYSDGSESDGASSPKESCTSVEHEHVCAYMCVYVCEERNESRITHRHTLSLSHTLSHSLTHDESDVLAQFVCGLLKQSEIEDRDT